MRGMLADRPRAVAALTKIFLTEIERLIDAAAAADILASENSGFSVDASVRITLLDRDVRSYFSKPRTLAAVLRPAALRARTPLRDPWPRRPHQSDPLRAAPTQGGQLGRAGSRAEVDAAGSQLRRRAHAAPSFSIVWQIVTNRLDLSAELIAEMYRLRWLIEMFFRTFKITSPRDIPGGVSVP